MESTKTPIWTAEMFQSYFDTSEEISMKKEFLERLNQAENFKTVVFKALKSYVLILTQIATTFVHEIIDIQERLQKALPAKMDAFGKSKLPFIHPLKPPCYSIASISLSVWENYFLENNTIWCIAPRQREDKCSKIEQKWAYFEGLKDDKTGEDVIHAAATEVYQKRFETKDGKCIGYPDFYNPNTKTIKWFHGCRWHRCESCLEKKRKWGEEDSNKTVVLDTTAKKFSEIRKHNSDKVGTKYEITRECQFRKSLKTNEEKYVERPLGRLQSRLAYRSGFSESLGHYFKRSSDTLLELYDVSSLYPFIAKTKTFTTGQFFVLTVLSIMKRVELTDSDILLDGKPFHGFCHARVLPPRNLLLPYLGVKTCLGRSKNSTTENLHEKTYHSTARGKSKWKQEEHQTHPLCFSCLKNETTKCRHSDEKRSILSVFNADEMRYMISLGYRFKKEWIYELWVFDPKNKKNIFENYIRFMELEKIRASKIPKNYVGKEQDYCDAVNLELGNTEELQLKPNDLRENDVKRATIKSLLNNLFGRKVTRFSEFCH